MNDDTDEDKLRRDMYAELGLQLGWGDDVDGTRDLKNDIVAALLPFAAGVVRGAPQPDDDMEWARMLTNQACVAGKHPDWFIDSENLHPCPWCEADAARSELAAVTETLRRLGTEYAAARAELAALRASLPSDTGPYFTSVVHQCCDLAAESSKELAALQQRMTALCVEAETLFSVQSVANPLVLVSALRAASAGAAPTEEVEQ